MLPPNQIFHTNVTVTKRPLLRSSKNSTVFSKIKIKGNVGSGQRNGPTVLGWPLDQNTSVCEISSKYRPVR